MKNTFTIKAFILLGTFFFLWKPSWAQDQVVIQGPVSQLVLEGDRVKCTIHGADHVSNEYHNKAEQLIQQFAIQPKSQGNGRKGTKGADIQVIPFNLDPTFSPDKVQAAIQAFQAAADIWAGQVDSDQTIFVLAILSPLGESVLGSAFSPSIFANFQGMEKDTWYGNALADKLAGEDLSPGDFDIIANFNTEFDNWHFDLNSEPENFEYDFKTVVLHELCHGLGFFGSMTVDDNGIGSWGFGVPSITIPSIYDRLAHDKPGKQLVKENKFPNFSKELGDVLLDDPLIFRGPNTVRATKGKGAKIFTVLDLGGNEIPGLTNTWLPGSSYSHVDFLTYAGGPEGLMVPFLIPGVAYDQPGEIVNGIFDDIGWNGKVNNKVPGSSARIALNDDPLLDNTLTTKIYPNPFKQTFSLQIDQGKINNLKELQIIDGAGRLFDFSYTRQNQQLNFNLDDQLKPGLYYLQLRFNDEPNKVFKLVKTY